MLTYLFYRCLLLLLCLVYLYIMRRLFLVVILQCLFSRSVSISIPNNNDKRSKQINGLKQNMSPIRYLTLKLKNSVNVNCTEKGFTINHSRPLMYRHYPLTKHNFNINCRYLLTTQWTMVNGIPGYLIYA